MPQNKKEDELRSVLRQLQAYEDNSPEPLKQIRQRDDTLEIERQQLREIKSIANNVRLLTILVVASILVDFFMALLSN